MATTDAARELVGVGLLLAAPPGRDPSIDILAGGVRTAEVAVGAGCTSLWVGEPAADPPARVAYEAFSLLGALAVRTDGILLGVAADGSQRRAPSILAKIVTGIDVLSHGRAVLSLDGDAAPDGDAVRLAEALEVARAVLEDEQPTVDGRIYHVDGAVNRPAPVQPGGVPLVVFVQGRGPGWSGLLDVCARAADAVVVHGGPEDVRAAAAALSGAGRARSRPGDRTLLLARVAAGPGTAASIDAVRSAGSDGCLVEVPAPWELADLTAAELSW